MVFTSPLPQETLTQGAQYDEHQVSEKQYDMNLICKKNLIRAHLDARRHLRKRDHSYEHLYHTRADKQNQIDGHRLHYR